jgi:hypothetical protein
MLRFAIRLSILFVLMLGACTAQAQEKGDIALKFSPTGLIDYYFTYLQFAGEYYIGNDMSVEAEVGFPIGKSQILDVPETDVRGGVRVRAGWRDYHTDRVFAGAQLMFKSDIFSIAGDFERQGGAFRQRIWYNVDQQTYAAYGTVGIAPIISNVFIFEAMAGLGVRYIDRQFGAVPGDAEFVTNGSLLAPYGESLQARWLPSMFLSFKLGVVF